MERLAISTAGDKVDSVDAVVAHGLLNSMAVVTSGVETLRARLDDLTPSKRDDLMRRILKHAAFVTEALQELTRGLPEQALEELERLRDRSRR